MSKSLPNHFMAEIQTAMARNEAQKDNIKWASKVVGAHVFGYNPSRTWYPLESLSLALKVLRDNGVEVREVVSLR